MYRYYLANLWLNGLRLSRLGRHPPEGFRILLFHDISRQSFSAFEKLVEHIVREHGVLTPGQAKDRLDEPSSGSSNPSSWRSPCLFSFDDGFVSNYMVAKQILERYGVKALFFVTPGIANLSGKEQRAAIANNMFRGCIDPRDLDPELRLMTWGELTELEELGHEIGCHGLSHRRLSQLDDAALEEEIIGAGDLLNEKLAQKTDWYAYAFGDIGGINKKALSVIARRYRYCRSGLRGANNHATHRQALRTDSLNPDAPLDYQKLLLEGGLDFHYRRANTQLAEWARMSEPSYK